MALSKNKVLRCLAAPVILAGLFTAAPDYALAVEDTALRVGTATSPGPDYFFRGANYDPAVPSPASVLGFEPGSRISTHAQIEQYFETLARALPDRVRLVTYGESWQGRRLFYAVIGSPQQIAQLDRIQTNARRLADPRSLSAAEANSIIAQQPAIVWLANSVHGDEPSPSDSAMMVAWHLLAARGDSRMANITANTLVIINPLQNPDGRERFIATSTSARGVFPDASAAAAERDQQWPGGRVNHYNFDLNRDWFALTQPETRGHTRALLDWFPQVMVDAHEMGTDERFFFPPEADPINPFHTTEQRALRALIGRNNGRRFDEAGVGYFTREIFDGFYPGYGDGWPTMHGTISMTYEQGSARGLVARRSDGTLLTYAETVRNQFIAAMSTIEATADNRERFLRSFWEFRRSAVEEGRTGQIRSYIIPAQADQATADHLAGLLVRQGVEVSRAAAGFSACGVSYGPGSHIVSAAQPTYRLIRNLLDRDVPMDAAFVARQQALKDRGLDDEIYDVTAWSLPLVFNVAVNNCNAVPQVAGQAVGNALRSAGAVQRQSAQVAWVAPSGSVAMHRLAIAGLRAGLAIRSVEAGFVLDGQRYPAGSLVIVRAENPANVEATLVQLAAETGAQLVGHDTSWVTEGPSLASSRAVRLRLPRVAMAWDAPVGRNSAGNARYSLEVKLGLPVTPVRVSRLARMDLRAFDVIVLPDAEGSYAGGFGSGGANGLKSFVQSGGVVVSFAGATRWLASESMGLISARPESAAGGPQQSAPSTAETVPGTLIANDDEYQAAIARRGAEPDGLNGALLRTVTDPEHWLTAGLAPSLPVMMFGSDIYGPLSRDLGENPVRFATADQLVAGGVVWQDSRAQLAFKPYVMVEGTGRGMVIGFTGDPTYRGQTDGLDGLLANAILQPVARTGVAR